MKGDHPTSKHSTSFIIKPPTAYITATCGMEYIENEFVKVENLIKIVT
jgi:hypothetical protein